MRKFIIVALLLVLGSSYIAQVKLLTEYLNEEDQPVIQLQTQKPQEKDKDKSDKREDLSGYPAPPDYPYPPPSEPPDYPYPPPSEPTEISIIPTWTPKPLPTAAPTMDVQVIDHDG
jgi:hypothetical protein